MRILALALAMGCNPEAPPVPTEPVPYQPVTGLWGSSTANGLQLTAIMDRATYTVGEPIRLDLVVSNLGTEPISLSPASPGLDHGTTAVRWTFDGNEEQYCGLTLVDDAHEAADLAAGADQLAVEHLTYGGVIVSQTATCFDQGATQQLAVAGSYTVRVSTTLSDEAGPVTELETGALVVTLVDPDDAEDLAALARLQDSDDGVWEDEAWLAIADENDTTLTVGVAAWSDVLTLQPNSLYARFAEYLLGIQASDTAVAIPHLERAMAILDDDDAQYRRTAQLELARAYGADGRTEEAREQLERLIASYGADRRHAVQVAEAEAELAQLP